MPADPLFGMAMGIDVTTATLSIKDEIARLRRLKQDGHHEQALDRTNALLVDLPENRDLVLVGAISLRMLGRIAEAIAMLDRLEQHHPHFSRMHQERGLCHVARKDAPRAIDALLRAVNINPALPMSWRM